MEGTETAKTGNSAASMTPDNWPPRGNDLAPRGNDLPPRGNDLPPRGNDLPPRGNDLPPRGNDLPPRGNDLPPRGNDLPPRGNDLPPRGHDWTPRGAPYLPKLVAQQRESAAKPISEHVLHQCFTSCSEAKSSRASAGAISSMGTTSVAAPRAIAARGIPNTAHDSSLSAIVHAPGIPQLPILPHPGEQDAGGIRADRLRPRSETARRRLDDGAARADRGRHRRTIARRAHRGPELGLLSRWRDRQLCEPHSLCGRKSFT
jgi:hypothetical protein